MGSFLPIKIKSAFENMNMNKLSSWLADSQKVVHACVSTHLTGIITLIVIEILSRPM